MQRKKVWLYLALVKVQLSYWLTFLLDYDFEGVLWFDVYYLFSLIIYYFIIPLMKLI